MEPWTGCEPDHLRNALTALILLLQVVAFRPFSRIRMTKFVSSSSVGFSVPNHLNDSAYHVNVLGETFEGLRLVVVDCKLLIFKDLVGAAGLEPATLCLEGRCSIHLSYAPGTGTKNRWCPSVWQVSHSCYSASSTQLG